jgi:cellobiose phosphorylase
VRQYRGATYQISVKNPKGVCKGVKSMTVDGKPVEATENGLFAAPIFKKGAHKVDVVMG